MKLKLLIFLLLTINFEACSQKDIDLDYETTNREVLAINNKAIKSLFHLITNNDTSRVIIDKIESELNYAISLDPLYKKTYLNLINCIEASNKPNYKPKRYNYLKEQIKVCNSWLVNHQNDKDILLKRGILLERDGDIILARKDYSKVLEHLNSLNISIIPNMTKPKIDDAVNIAYLYLIVEKPEKSRKIINELVMLYPNDYEVNFAFRDLSNISRAEFIFKQWTFN